MRCEICGYKDNVVVFDFHHTNELNYRSDWSSDHGIGKKIKILKNWLEIGKPKDIMILCANCHRIIHYIPPSEMTPSIP